MSDIEEVQAAIAKLEALIAAPLVAANFTGVPERDWEWFERVTEKLGMFHRALEAQLAILERTLLLPGTFCLRFNPVDHSVLALARAINGTG